MIGKIIIALIAASVAFIIGVRMIVQRAPQPDRLGIAGGRLLPCPDTPNCASSFEGLSPFTYTVERSSARDALLKTLEEWPRTTLIQATEDYVHVEFRSRVFSFIDDGEFYFSETESVIHYRSAARTGRSDFGVNASRISDIENALGNSLE